MSAALITVLMAAAGTALLAFVGFRLGLSVDRRFKSPEEVRQAVLEAYNVTADLAVLMSRNQRAAIAYASDESGYVVVGLGDKVLVRNLDQAKIMIISDDRLYISFPDFGFEPVYLHAEPNEIQQALVGLGRGHVA